MKWRYKVFEVGSRSWPRNHSLGTLTDVRDGCGKLCGFDSWTLSGHVFVICPFSGPYVRVFSSHIYKGVNPIVINGA